MDKTKKRTTKISSVSQATLLSQKPNVLNLKKKTPLIEIHLPVIFDFYTEHKKNILTIVSVIVCVSILTSFFHAKASTAIFYPSNCLGGWQHPENAQLEGTVPEDSPLERFTTQNSSVLENSSAELYCGKFDGEIPKDTLPKKFVLSLNWSVDNGSVMHDTWRDLQVSNEENSSSKNKETTDENIISPTSSSVDADTSSEVTPPTGAESISIPQDAGNALQAPSVDPTGDQSFLDIFFPKKVHAQDEPAPESIQAPQSSSEEITTEATIPVVISDSTLDAIDGQGDKVNTNAVLQKEDSPSGLAEQNDTTVEATPDAFASIAYTLDGSIWNTIGRVSIDNWRNARFELPLGAWDDISHLQIAIRPIQTLDRQPVVYLDSMQIAVEYEEGKIFQKPTVIIKNDDAQVLEGHSDFTSDEAPMFAVVDPNLSTREIADLVKEKKAEVVQDEGKVLSPNTENEVAVPGNSSKTFFDDIKNIFSSSEKNETPVQEKTPEALPAVDEPSLENSTQTQNPLPSVEVIEGVPPEDAPVVPSASLIEEAKGSVSTLFNNLAIPKITKRTSASLSKKTKKEDSTFALFAPLIAHAEDILSTTPKITDVRVLDYYGNPTTIKTSIQTVTIDGETRDGVIVEKQQRHFRAGRYTLEVTVETADAIIISEQDFTWGVLAINTDKSIYTEGDNAYLQMGILDEKGYSLCDANLHLVVKSPSGSEMVFSTDDKTILHSTKCGRNNIVEVPDYYANYPVPSESGRYQMTLTAVTENGTKKVVDTFDVGHPDFDVSRTAPTRIFPFTAYDYPMTIRITSKNDWSGTVQEIVPAGFIISQPKKSQRYDSVKFSSEISTITWTVDLKAGEEAVIGYLFKGPEISPEFFLLGPLEFFEKGSDPKIATPTFAETRQWQIADDATCNATTTGNWNTGSNWTGCSGAGGIPGTGDNITIDATKTITMNVNSPVLGSITVNGTLDTSGTNYSLTGTTLTIGASGTLTANASTITLSGTSGTLFTLTGGGTFTQGTSEVIITSASGTPTLLSAATTFHRLTINSAATVINAGAAITMSSANSANRLYVQAGVLNDGGNQITGTANGTLIVNSSAALCIGGTASATNATCDSGATPTTATTFPTNYTNGNITLTAGSTTSGWYNASWGYRTKITIDHTKVPSTQTDFPVLISKTDTRLKTVANGGHMGNAGATDMVITSSDGTTKLNHQIEYYVATTGQIIAWVKVPSLSSSTDTDLYLYYGNAGVADQQNVTGTWNSNYKQVLHVSDGTTLSVADSTGNYNGTNSGSTAAAGQIDGGAAQTGGQYIANGATLYTMIGGSAAHTISFWENMTSFSGGDQYVWDFDTAQGLGAFMNIALDNQIQWGYSGGSGGYRTYSAISPVMTAGTWHYVVAQKTAAGQNAKLYVDGTLQTGTGSGGTIGDPANTGSSGGQWGRYHSSTTLAMDGVYDEMHILNVATSADWITAEYNNQNAPSTFIPTWATEEVSTIPDAIVYYNADAATTISSTPTYRDLKITPQLTAARTYTFASGSTTINGNFTINPTRSSAALLTVNMGGNITVASTKTTTITRTTSATSTLVSTSSNYSLSSGLVVTATGGTLDFTSSTGTLTLTGTTGTLLTNTGGFTQGSSTVSVTSATGPVALLSGSQTFHILTINSASSSTVVNAGAAVTIDNASGAALTITSGVLNDSGLGIATSGSSANTLTLGSSGTLCLGGAAGSNTSTTCDTSATSTTARSMPSFASYSFNSTSTVIYLSDAATTVANTQTYGNLTLKPTMTAARTYTLGGAMTINGNFEINPGTAANLLTVNAGGNITVPAGKTTTITRTTSATSTLDLRPSSTDYNLSTGLLVVATGGTLDAGSSAAVITLTATSGTLFTRTGTFTQGNSVVTLSGNGAATINSGTITFYDLTQTGTGTKTVGSSSAITINHDLIISAGEFAPNLQLVTASGTNVLSVASGATLYVDASTFAGNYTGFDTRTISAGSTVDYKLAGTQTVDSTLTYSNLVISGASGTKSPDGNITATLTFVQSGGNTFDLLPGSTDYNLTTGNLTIGSGCTLDGTSSSAEITLTGTSGTLFTKTGTYTQGTTTVIVTSASGSPTLLSAATTFHRLTINALATVINAGAAITMSSISAANRLYIQKGVLNDGGNQIAGTANGTLLIGGGGTLCIGGTATGTNATCDSGATPTSATTFPTNYTNGNITMYSSATAASWYNSSWGYRTKIIIDYSKVSTTNHTDFPVLINTTNVDWKYTSSGGHVGNSDGSDILFTSSDGTTKLKHEIERYTSTSGEVIAWIKVPTLSSSADTVLYMYYGNAGVAAQADAANVWDSNFKTVLHLGDGTTLSAASSTGINNGTKVGTISALAGKIGGAACANGTTQCSGTASTSNGLTFTTFSSTTSTLTAWIKLDNASGYQNVAALNATNGIWLNAGKMDLYTTSDHNANTSVGTGAWVHVGMTYDGTTIRYYYNGATDGTGSESGFNYQINAMFKDATGVAETLKGSMDEIRFSNVVRSAGWIATEYNNMNSPSTFYSLGMEDVYGASAAIVYYNADATTTVSATPTYADLRFRPVLTANKTYTISSALTINGDLSINPSGSANTLTVNAGGDITAASGTISITRQGSSALSLFDLRPSSTDYNLSSKYLTIATGGTLDATSAASSITITGTSGTLITFGGTFNVGTTTTTISGNGTATLNSGTGNFYNLVLNATGTKTLGANITIDPAATLTVTTGTLDTSSGSNYQISAGHISIATAGTLTLNNSAVSLTGTSGTLITRSGSGVFGGVGSTSSITISGNGTATLNSGTLTTTANRFYDLVSSGTGTKTLGAAIDIGNIFGVTGGTFAASSNNITTASVTIGASGTLNGGSATITNTGNWSNSGTFTGSTGTVAFTGTGAQSISGATTWNNLTITTSTARTVSFQSSVTQTIPTGATLTLTGASGQLLTLAPITAATTWLLNVSAGATQAITYVTPSYSDASSGTTILATDGTSVDGAGGGTNTNWSFFTPPTLTFSLSANSVPLSTLTTAGTGSGSHTITMSTNTGALLLSYIGATLTHTNGISTIPAYSALSNSVAGTAGFGINAVDTSIVNTSGTCTAATNYATASKYTFVAGSMTPFVSSSAPATCTVTATYKANINTVTPAGSYSTGLTYIVSGTF